MIEQINNGDSGLITRNKINNNAKCILLGINFVDVETLSYTNTDNFKIDTKTIVAGSTSLITIKLAGTTTDYILGETVIAGDYLDISVDAVGFIKLEGEKIL